MTFHKAFWWIFLISSCANCLQFDGATSSFAIDILANADHDCHLQLVESIPIGLEYNGSNPNNLPTFEAWKILLNLTESSLDLASSYWSLRGSDVFQHPSDWQGEWIYENLIKASERQVSIRIAQNDQPNNDTTELGKLPGIEVKALDFPHLMGAGILHTKLWIADKKHFYVGSANFDWRSLTQVKELGVLALNCPTLSHDMSKIFDAYWKLGGPNQTIPESWPHELETRINSQNPLALNDDLSIFLSSSPPPFCPKGREVDLDAVLQVIDNAEKFIYVAVMDYSPTFLYGKAGPVFWPVIDNHLRKAIIERKVEVKLLFSQWNHTKPDMISYMKSLEALDAISSVQTRLFEVPAFSPDQAEIPFARVNHNKYMVTDKQGYIGTSNWSADYFVNTGGIGVVFTGSLHSQILDVFDRDWYSVYSHGITGK